RLSFWDHGPTCVVGQLSCLGPRSHLHHCLGFQPGTTVPPASLVRLSAWDHGCIDVNDELIFDMIASRRAE
ncbi:hypothetical protein E3U37_24695, partial [Klebsiella pneumoniae subsp. pneumoniae]